MWLSAPRTNASGRQGALEDPQAPLAHVAEPGVVGAALGVVVVRDDRRAQAGRRPSRSRPASQCRVVADLVDLVDGHGHDPEGQRRRAGHGHAIPPSASLSTERAGTGPPAHWARA